LQYRCSNSVADLHVLSDVTKQKRRETWASPGTPAYTCAADNAAAGAGIEERGALRVGLVSVVALDLYEK